MRYIHTLVVLSWSILIVGLSVAYASAGVGLAGLIDVRRAALAAIVATAVAFAALVTHFFAAMREMADHNTAHRFK